MSDFDSDYQVALKCATKIVTSGEGTEARSSAVAFLVSEFDRWRTEPPTQHDDPAQTTDEDPDE